MASNATHLKEESSQVSLKHKMSAVIEDCAKYRQLSAQSTQELELVRAKRSEVCLILFYIKKL